MNRPRRLLGAATAILGAGLLVAGLLKVGERPAKLTWRTPEVKSAMMSVGYKVYGNRNAEFGRHYLSRIAFKNEGDHPVRDFSISYKLENFIPWTEPDTVKEVPAGFSFVELYYPKLPATVSNLRNSATTTLYTRIKWKEEGREREETLSHEVTLRAVNEIAYCDLPQSEVQGWPDYYNCAAFTVAMVTPNDPVVALYASEITKQSGGTLAGVAGGPQEVARICKAVYDYMTQTGLRYVGSQGIPSNYDNISTILQNVRLPRDVIINNQGLCIELTLLWASILEHLGVQAAVTFKPGHAFIVAYSPRQGMSLENGLPIECTAVSPMAVGRKGPVPFEDAVKMAMETVQHGLRVNEICFLSVQHYQAAGFSPPELPDVDITRLADTLAGRLGRMAQATRADVRRPVDASRIAPPMPSPNSGNTYHDPEGNFSIDVPPQWTAKSNQGAGVILTHGASWGTISTFGGVTKGREVVTQLVRQFAGQYKNFCEIKRGDAAFGGQPAAYALFSGVNQKGVALQLTIIGIDANGAGGPAYAMIFGVPQSDFALERAALEQIQASFQLGTANVAASPLIAPSVATMLARTGLPAGGANLELP